MLNSTQLNAKIQSLQALKAISDEVNNFLIDEMKKAMSKEDILFVRILCSAANDIQSVLSRAEIEILSNNDYYSYKGVKVQINNICTGNKLPGPLAVHDDSDAEGKYW